MSAVLELPNGLPDTMIRATPLRRVGHKLNLPGLKMPEGHPRMAHYMPYLYGDSLPAIVKAHQQGYLFKDTDIQACLHDKDDDHPEGVEIFACHWGTPDKAGLNKMWSGPDWGKGHLVDNPYGGKPWSEINYRFVKRMTNSHGDYQLHTLRYHFREGVAQRVVLVPEAKANVLFNEAKTWKYFVRVAGQEGHPAVMMTLTNIGQPYSRIHAAVEGGMEADHCAFLNRTKKPSFYYSSDILPHVKNWGKWSK